MKTINDTRTAILDLAQDLVQRQSISGVSFQELANRIGIKKGSMYYHFESKDELSIALLERVTDQLKESFKRGEHKSATQRLKFFIGIYLSFIEVGSKLCTGGAFAGEWGSLAVPVQAAAKRLIQAQVKGVASIIAAGIKDGEFVLPEQDAEKLANWVMSSLQGGLLVSRVMESAQPFHDSVQIIYGYFGIE